MEVAFLEYCMPNFKWHIQISYCLCFFPSLSPSLSTCMYIYIYNVHMAQIDTVYTNILCYPHRSWYIPHSFEGEFPILAAMAGGSCLSWRYQSYCTSAAVGPSWGMSHIWRRSVAIACRTLGVRTCPQRAREKRLDMVGSRSNGVSYTSSFELNPLLQQKNNAR